jgi:hypothetical protein
MALPHVAGAARLGPPRRRPNELYVDPAYDHDKNRKAVRGKGIRPHIARRGQAHGSGLGVFRYRPRPDLPMPGEWQQNSRQPQRP